jgi:hypothetical protein
LAEINLSQLLGSFSSKKIKVEIKVAGTSNALDNPPVAKKDNGEK